MEERLMLKKEIWLKIVRCSHASIEITWKFASQMPLYSRSSCPFFDPMHCHHHLLWWFANIKGGWLVRWKWCRYYYIVYCRYNQCHGSTKIQFWLWHFHWLVGQLNAFKMHVFNITKNIAVPIYFYSHQSHGIALVCGTTLALLN